jgi:hypothetical protein
MLLSRPLSVTLDSETANFWDTLSVDMDSEQWIAIFFVVLMIGSTIALGVGSLL